MVLMKKGVRLKSKHILIGITVFLITLSFITIKIRPQITFVEKGIGLVVMPIQKGLTNIENWFSDKVYDIKKIKTLGFENELLLKEINELKYENKILQQDKVELARLRNLYELDQKYAKYPKIGAQVIGKDPGNWYNVFLIDKGENDGLKVNMVVLSGNGLVGHIIEVGPGYSKVLSIIDDDSSVSSKILRTSDLSFVTGDKILNGKGLCKVEYLDNDAEIVVGDEVVTSHLGSIYPPGILIGNIKEIKYDENNLTKYAYISPVVDFKHLEEVLVLNTVWNRNEENRRD